MLVYTKCFIYVLPVTTKSMEDDSTIITPLNTIYFQTKEEEARKSIELLSEQKTHPLLFQPLLENTFKYVGGEYRIWLSFKLEGEAICFTLEKFNSRPEY